MGETASTTNLVYKYTEGVKKMSHKQPVKANNNGSWNGYSPAVKIDPEVVPKAKRRMFSAEYKLRILAEADSAVPWTKFAEETA